MSMNGIDISSWQAGIDLTVVPCDFVIIKATQGTDYVNQDCDRAFQQAKAAGKCLGVYHYASGGDPIAEADFFLENVAGYIGESILVLDWEGEQNGAFGANDFAWVKTWMDYVASRAGVKPILYISASIIGLFSGIGDYGLWVAQYSDMNATGYQETPWNEGAYDCVIRQYSSNGRLPGYAGGLDINKFYGDRNTWNAYAGKAETTQVKPEVKPKQVPGTAKNNVGLKYRAHVQDVGDCEEVRDGQTAGTKGFSKRLEAIAIDVDSLRKVKGYENLVINVLAHIQDIGDKTYKDIKSKTVIGTKNEKRRL